MRTRTNPRKPFPFGFCTTGHHSYCRGAVRRPKDPETGEERLYYCSCRCHEGKEVAPAPEIVKPRKLREVHAEQVQNWKEQLILRKIIIVDEPSDPDERKATLVRMRRAGKESGLKLRRTVIQDGKMILREEGVRRPRRESK